ncbi:MAG: hypothetical protein EXQ70_00875 [Solirubrobacterales bacterium]|nr:hypothetical protein [Solirubrobacterales bacterium]
MTRRVGVAVALITLAGLGLRLLGLDSKGYWQDEALTVSLVRMDLGGMLDGITEVTYNPPLHYLFAWPWVRLFGDGEVGLRSLSVLAGAATVPVAFLAARELISERAGLFAAALVAVNPLRGRSPGAPRPHARALGPGLDPGHRQPLLRSLPVRGRGRLAAGTARSPQGGDPLESPPPPPRSGFELVEQRRESYFLLFRYRSSRPL